MNFFSKVNLLAKKKRHFKVHEIVVDDHKSGDYLAKKKSEKEFFWKVVSLGTFVFFLASILPNFVATETEFWLPVEASAYHEVMEKYAYAEEGFLMTTVTPTEKGNRTFIDKPIEITVESGDTISTLAQKYGVSIATIMENNSLSNPNKLKVGQNLLILPVDGLIYSVEKSDTVASIAKKFKLDTDKIIAQNNLQDGQELQVGQTIILPGIRKVKPPVVATINSRGNTVYQQIPSNTASGVEFNGKLFFPCQGKYTQYYHYGHYAVDIAQNGGSPIWSAEGGKVIKAQGGWNGGYGNVVIIDHGSGMTTLYAHLRDIYVNVGQQVGRGQAIGYMGNTGRVYGRTGIHLHFEVTVNGVKKNPIAYF